MCWCSARESWAGGFARVSGTIPRRRIQSGEPRHVRRLAKVKAIEEKYSRYRSERFRTRVRHFQIDATELTLLKETFDRVDAPQRAETGCRARLLHGTLAGAAGDCGDRGDRAGFRTRGGTGPDHGADPGNGRQSRGPRPFKRWSPTPAGRVGSLRLSWTRDVVPRSLGSFRRTSRFVEQNLGSAPSPEPESVGSGHGSCRSGWCWPSDSCCWSRWW